MRYICFVFILLSSYLFAQNQSYQLYEDSIFPLLESNYNSAKNKLLNFEKNVEFDPAYKLSFLEYSLENNDFEFFKKEVSTLIENYGYYYTVFDTMPQNLSITINLAIKDSGLSKWLIKTSRELYPIWVGNHPEAISYTNQLDQIRIADQQIRKISFVLLPGLAEIASDSIVVQSFYKIYDSLKNCIDLENLINLQSICINNNGLPTNYDSGFSVYKKIGLIITHNLKEGKNLKQTWKRIYPYIEKAYLEGKISNGLLYEYDYYLNIHYGHQYYGFLEDVPVTELETFNERKNKFGIK